MIYAVKGILEHAEPYLAVIDTGGVCYACNSSLTSLSRVKKGDKVTFYTYLHLREGICELYGFVGREELGMFRQLLGITGVGPKAALSILSVATPEKLALAVLGGEEKILTAAPGVGKKLAQRIILELKDKMGKLDTSEGLNAQDMGFTPLGGGKLAEAQAALGVLGFSMTEVAAALRGVDVENMTVEEIIRSALRRNS